MRHCSKMEIRDDCCIIRDKLLAPSPPNFSFLVCVEGRIYMLSIIIEMITHNISNKIKRQANNSEQPNVYQFITHS